MSHPKNSSYRPTTRRWIFTGLPALLLVGMLLVGGLAGSAQAQSTPDTSTTQTTPDSQGGQATPGPSGAQPTPNIHDVKDLTSGDEGNTNSEDNDKGLSSDELGQLAAIQGGAIQGPELDQLKALAVQKIAQFGPKVIERLDDKSRQKAETRLLWVAIVIVGIIPGLALIVFLLYPLVRRKAIAQRAPGASLGQVYRLYLPQAVLVTIVLIGLGIALWGVQFLTVQVLGGVTNPQVVLQKEAINYIITDRQKLVDDYTDMFIGLAEDLTNADPEKPVMDIILENALQLKEDPVVRTANNIIKFVMPFLNYLSLVIFGLLVLFFLIRIRPDIMRLLTYPVDILEAEQKGQHLPEFNSVASGVIPAGENSAATMREIGRRLMWTEVKVIALFAVAILAVAAIMSLALIAFFSQITRLLVTSLYAAAEHFLTTENSSGPLLWATIILMVFVVECVVVFLLTFILALIKLQAALRLRFGEQITWQQTGLHMRRVGLRFGWAIVLLIILGVGLPFLAAIVDDALYNSVKDANYELILFGIPIVLLVGLTLGMWLLRGFKMIGRLLLISAAKDLGLNNADTAQKIEATATNA